MKGYKTHRTTEGKQNACAFLSVFGASDDLETTEKEREQREADNTLEVGVWSVPLLILIIVHKFNNS